VLAVAARSDEARARVARWLDLPGEDFERAGVAPVRAALPGLIALRVLRLVEGPRERAGVDCRVGRRPVDAARVDDDLGLGQAELAAHFERVAVNLKRLRRDARVLRVKLLFHAVNVKRLPEAVRVIWGEDDVDTDNGVVFRLVVVLRRVAVEVESAGGGGFLGLRDEKSLLGADFREVCDFVKAHSFSSLGKIRGDGATRHCRTGTPLQKICLAPEARGGQGFFQPRPTAKRLLKRAYSVRKSDQCAS
jgi:hypothetical protein